MSPEDKRKPVTRGEFEQFAKANERWKKGVLLLIAAGLGAILLLVGSVTLYLNSHSERAVRHATAQGLIENIQAERRSCERLDDVRSILYQLLTVAIAAQRGDQQLAQTEQQRIEQEQSALYFKGLLRKLVKGITPPEALEVTGDVKPKDGLPDEIHVNCAKVFPFPGFALETLSSEALRKLEEAIGSEPTRSAGGKAPQKASPNPAGDESPGSPGHGDSGGSGPTTSPGGGAATQPTSPSGSGGGKNGGGQNGGGGHQGGSPGAGSPPPTSGGQAPSSPTTSAPPTAEAPVERGPPAEHPEHPEHPDHPEHPETPAIVNVPSLDEPVEEILAPVCELNVGGHRVCKP